ncbi:Arginine transport ATP-binding protein ArtM [Roseovarius litorisediminis]|uniref:Arginine transport ATP-binding protein ArtM n=1 Tax=Roseovarius litorisediminis TaxID=1312363 RepID=A0A1Y5SH25_9RHOB|nr:ATP-binding cassette domain-containing protein [Roseovarius litorisediminis]SLN40631.1 Arginine transport ATP-binding protein ArtM [Roseovarius litorisediminis]
MSELFPLTVQGAKVQRRGKVLLGPVDLTLEGQGVTVVIGPNGAGKTSLLKMLHGIVRLSAGKVTWACGQTEAQRRQGFVFQAPVMLRRTVLENLTYPLQLANMAKPEAMARAKDWTQRIGLGDAQTRQATVLSGGERQKLALARALIRDPDVLFLDEPCASLDGRAMREIEEILQAAAKSGTRIIMSTHDMGQARRLATEVIFILRGKVHEFAQAGAFFNSAQTVQAREFLNGDIVE